MTPLVSQNLDDKGEITDANKSIQRGLASEEEERRSSQNMEEQSAQNKVIENSIPTGTGDGENVPDHETVGGEIGASRSMKTGQKRTLAGWHQKDKDPMGKMVRICQGEGGETTEQQGRHSTVHRFL